MKKTRLYIIVLICFMLLPIAVIGQEKVIDSLKKELETYTKRDTVRVKILNHLAYYHYRSNPSKSLEYAEEAGKLADEIHSIKGKARSFYMIGIVYLEQADFETSVKNFENSTKLYNSIDDLKGIAGCKNALGVLYNYKGDLKLALKYYEEALAIDTKLGVKENIPNYLYNMGDIYSDTGKYKEAVSAFQDALEAYTKNKNEHGILNCLNAIAIVYVEQGNYPLSLEYHNKSLEVSKKAKDSIGMFQSYSNIGNVYRQQELYDKALSYYDKALKIKQSNFNTKNIIAIKNNIGGVHIDKKDFNRAIIYFQESINLSREINDNENLPVALNGLGSAYLGINEYSEALRNFQEANKITQANQKQYDLLESYIGMANAYYHMKKYNLALVNAEIGAQLADEFKLLKHQRNAYELLSKIQAALGEYKMAFTSYQQFKVANDSLFNKENIEKISQLEAEYKYKQQLDSLSINELKLTKTVLTTKQDLEKSKRNLFLGVIGFLITALILGGIIFFLRLRNEKSKTQNAVIEQKLLRSQMTPHFIFNSLSVLQGMILNKEEKKSVHYLSKFSKLLRITLENSRDKLVPLNQELEAVNNYLELQNLEASESYDYTILIEETIDETLFKIPPMLIQPFIENAIEHGFKNQKENRKIDIQLKYRNDELICTITDNGVGIDVPYGHKRSDKKSLATAITSERLKMLSKDLKTKGSIKIEDRKQYNEQGTMVTLVIPYTKDDTQ